MWTIVALCFLISAYSQEIVGPEEVVGPKIPEYGKSPGLSYLESAGSTYFCNGRRYKFTAYSTTDAERWVAAHNYFRCLHGMDSDRYYAWDTALAQLAEASTDSYCLDGAAVSEPNFANHAYDVEDIEAAVESWYNEVRVFNPYRGQNPAWDHYTRLMWQSTTK